MGLFSKKQQTQDEAEAERRLREDVETLRAVLRFYKPGTRVHFGSPTRCPHCGDYGFVNSVNRTRGVSHNHCFGCQGDWVISVQAIQQVESETPTKAGASGFGAVDPDGVGPGLDRADTDPGTTGVPRTLVHADSGPATPAWSGGPTTDDAMMNATSTRPAADDEPPPRLSVASLIAAREAAKGEDATGATPAAPRVHPTATDGATSPASGGDPHAIPTPGSRTGVTPRTQTAPTTSPGSVSAATPPRRPAAGVLDARAESSRPAAAAGPPAVGRPARGAPRGSSTGLPPMPTRPGASRGAVDAPGFTSPAEPRPSSPPAVGSSPAVPGPPRPADPFDRRVTKPAQPDPPPRPAESTASNAGTPPAGTAPTARPNPTSPASPASPPSPKRSLFANPSDRSVSAAASPASAPSRADLPSFQVTPPPATAPPATTTPTADAAPLPTAAPATPAPDQPAAVAPPSIPLATPAPDGDEQPIVLDPQVPTATSAKLRVLVVEDNPFDLALIEEIAESAADPIHLVSATTRNEAERLAANATFDIILLGLDLPDSAGIPTLLEWQHSAVSGAPVIVLIGHSEAGVIREAKALGAFHVIQKSQLAELADGGPSGAERLVRLLRSTVKKHASMPTLGT